VPALLKACAEIAHLNDVGTLATNLEVTEAPV